MSKCPFCKNRINRYDGQHIYRCNKNMHIWNKRDVKYEYLLFNFPIISKRNIIFDEYVVKNKSLPDIKKEYNINYKNILFLLDYFDIKKRTLKTSSKQISSKKYKKTCLIKYGLDNVSKVQSIKDKKKIKKDYTIDKDKFEKLINMFLSNEISSYNTIVDKKIKKELKKEINEYHRYWNDLNDEQKDFLMGKDSKYESRISKCMDNLGISYITKYQIGKKYYDFKIYGTSIIIEVNSDFWHANPLIYKRSDKLNFPFGKITSWSIWKKDQYKKEIAENYNYKIIQIWESDIKDLNDQELLKFMINELLRH